MAISDDLNSIRTHLEDDYTALEQLGVSVEDRNIENIKDMANQIYAKFPKTSYAEGSNITLENCLKGKLDFEDGKVGYGDTEQEGEPTPTTPIPIQVVTGEQEVVVRGKNLVEGLEYGDINAQTGIENAATGTVRTTNYMPYSRLESYRQSINGENLSNGTNLRFYNKDKVYIGYATFGYSTSIQDISITIGSGVTTTDLEPKFFRVRANATTLPVDSKYMIATSDDLTYEPYITPITKQLSLGDIELAKIGTYKDYIYKNNGKWYKHSEVNKKRLVKSLVWNTAHKEHKVFYTEGITDYWLSINNIPLCNYFIGVEGVNNAQGISNNGNNKIAFSKTTGVYRTFITDDSYSVANDFGDYLDANQIFIYYPLATATDTEITDTTLINQLEDIYNMQSVNGTTIVEINSNLPMIMKVRALKNG